MGHVAAPSAPRARPESSRLTALPREPTTGPMPSSRTLLHSLLGLAISTLAACTHYSLAFRDEGKLYIVGTTKVLLIFDRPFVWRCEEGGGAAARCVDLDLEFGTPSVAKQQSAPKPATPKPVRVGPASSDARAGIFVPRERPEQDCATSQGCRLAGRCHLKGGVCTVGDDSDCRRSEGCRVDGRCGFADGGCVATSSTHCADSDACRTRGACERVGDHCLAPRRQPLTAP